MSFPVIDNNQISITQSHSAQDLINRLPQEILNEIFLFLEISDLSVCSQVCRNWKSEIDDPEKSKKRMYKQIAFTPEDWCKYLKNVIFTDQEYKEAFLSLPNDIYKILKSACPAFSGKRLGDTHLLVWIPKNINGNPLTINSFGELVKQYFPKSKAGYGWSEERIRKQEGDKTIDQSGWVLITKNVLPESRNKSYVNQKGIVSNLAKKALIAYEVPTALKTLVCILTHHFKTGTRHFTDNPWTSTCCQESVNGYQLAVGGFDKDGLCYVYCQDLFY